jgi:hypothetical protein
MNLHINQKLILGNNKASSIEEGEKETGYVEYFKYNLGTDLKLPAAVNLAKDK